MSETFYRKYRSNTFDEIVGQQHIIQTLKNAITNDRLSHAYIFSGPRGTGKTSMARILSKSLNCRNGKSTTPCLTCDICQNITNGHSVDVIEIDAASNTGVDNIRDLNDRINFMPVECVYKIYIIDEVHMLSTGAFNALLKTLEEPPENTLFILATTEPHKIPATIHSRCQHLYFRNLTHEELTQHLSYIAKKESITIDEKSVSILARNAEGCMRDGVSLLDQMVAFKGNTIISEDVLFILGTTEDKYLYEVLESVFKKDDKSVLKKLQTLFNNGANVMQLVADLLTILRTLLFVKLNLENELNIEDSQLKQAQQVAKLATITQINQVLDTVASTEMDLRWFSKPQLLLQSKLIQAMHSDTQESQKNTPEPIPQSTPRPQSVVTTPKPQPVIAAEPPDMETSVVKPSPPPPSITNPAVKLDQSSENNWQKVMHALQELKSPVYGILRQSSVKAISDDFIQIKLKQDFKFFREKVTETQNVILLNNLIKDQYKKPLKFTIENITATNQEISQPKNPTPLSPQADQHAERINEVVRMFEGTVI